MLNSFNFYDRFVSTNTVNIEQRKRKLHETVLVHCTDVRVLLEKNCVEKYLELVIVYCESLKQFWEKASEVYTQNEGVMADWIKVHFKNNFFPPEAQIYFDCMQFREPNAEPS